MPPSGPRIPVTDKPIVAPCFKRVCSAISRAHSRLTAYVAWKTQNATLARRAWSEFARDFERPNFSPTKLEGPAVLNPVAEAAWVSTNDMGQWGAAAIQNLALIGDTLPTKD